MKNIYCFLFGCALISTVNAQWNLDTLVRNPISISGSPEGGIIMQHDPSGGLYISWLMADFNGRVSIMAQRLDNNGNKLWNSTGKVIAPGSIGGYIEEYLITPSDSGSCLVVWTRQGDDLCAQRFDSNGDTLFLPYKEIYSPASGSYFNATFTIPDDSGGAIIIFKESSKLKIVRIDKFGNMLWANPKTLVSSPSVSSFKGIVPDGENGALYFYQPSAPNYTCYVQHVNRVGINTWNSPVTLTSNGNFTTDIQSGIAWDPVTGGSFFMYYNTNNFNYYLQHVDTAGNLRWGNGGLQVFPGRYNEVIADGQGGVFHSYVVLHAPDTTHAQYVIKHYDQNGTSLWNSPDTIVCEPSITSLLHQGTESYHRLVLDNSGGVIISWDEMRNNRLCIYSQRYNPAGYKMWRGAAFPVITANNQLATNGCGIPCDNLNHKLISFGDSSAVAAWHDTRHGNQINQDIYASLIDGVFSTGIEDLYQGTTLNLYPNPADSKISLEFETAGQRQIQVCNVIGEIFFQTSMNDYQITIDVQSFQAGIYFVFARQGLKNAVVKKFAKI